MSETLQLPPVAAAELAPQANHLPIGKELGNVYIMELLARDLPESFAPVGMHEDYDVMATEYDGEPLTLEGVQNAYIAKKVDEAVYASWWDGMSRTLLKYGGDENAVNTLQLQAKYDVAVTSSGEKTDQGFEIFDFGDSPVDAEDLDVITQTLRDIDQYSAGLLSTMPDRPKIAIVNDMSLRHPETDRTVMGLATPEVITLSMKDIYRSASNHEVDPKDVLAKVFVHELLGHGLERAVEGDTGKRFAKYFSYSEDKIQSPKKYGEIHADVIALDDDHKDSKPVREYGKKNAAEDLATSVEGAYERAHGDPDNVKEPDDFSTEHDEYRRDLVIQLFEDAAHRAKFIKKTPGFVGSRLRYARNEAGNTVLQPLRKLEVSRVEPQLAVRQELKDVLNGIKLTDKELRVLVLKSSVY